MGNRIGMKNDIVLAAYPFDDLSGVKVRPALCLTNPVGVLRHIVLAYITSNVPNRMEPSDLLLLPGSPEFRSTGLRLKSAIRLHRLLTVTTASIQRRLGTLNADGQLQIEQKLRAFLEL